MQNWQPTWLNLYQNPSKSNNYLNINFDKNNFKKKGQNGLSKEFSILSTV